MRQERTVEDLQNQGLSKFNSSSSSSSLQKVLAFCSKAITILDLDKAKTFLFHEDHFDFVIADFRGNEYVRCVRVGESSVYSGQESRFIVWANFNLFKSIKDSV